MHGIVTQLLCHAVAKGLVPGVNENETYVTVFVSLVLQASEESS